MRARSTKPGSLGLFGVVLAALLFVRSIPILAHDAKPAEQPLPEKPSARELLEQGVEAYKRNDFDAAIVLFQKAKEADPTLVIARLYLATAYANLYIPGVTDEKNVAQAKQAIEEFRGALELDPKNIPAIDGIGSLVFNLASNPYDEQKMMESRSFHLKHIELKPDDPEAYYWVGLIDWTVSFKANAGLRRQYTPAEGAPPLKDGDPLPAALCARFQAQYGSTIDDGIEALKKAIQLRPDYDDAMAFLNLLYRQKADEFTTEEDRERYLQMADDLIIKIKDLKVKAAQKQSPQ